MVLEATGSILLALNCVIFIILATILLLKTCDNFIVEAHCMNQLFTVAYRESAKVWWQKRSSQEWERVGGTLIL